MRPVSSIELAKRKVCMKLLRELELQLNEKGIIPSVHESGVDPHIPKVMMIQWAQGPWFHYWISN